MWDGVGRYLLGGLVTGDGAGWKEWVNNIRFRRVTYRPQTTGYLTGYFWRENVGTGGVGVP